MRPRPLGCSFAAWLGVSAGLHAAAVGVLGIPGASEFLARASAWGAPELPPADEPPPHDPGVTLWTIEEPEPEVELGSGESQADAPAWVGFEDPTEHEAPKGQTEQPALTLTPPGGGGNPAALGEQGESAPAALAHEAIGDGAETNPTSRPSVSALPPDDALPPMLDMLDAFDEAAYLVRPEVERPDVPRVDEAILPSAAGEPADAARARAETAPEPAPGEDGPAGNGVGIQSDAESDATSLKEPVVVRLGRPLVRAGDLEIRPRKPRWSLVTQMTALPKSPLMRITFGRDGRVSQAEFVPGQTSGYTDVDGPLLSAVYEWRASGPSLERLPKDDPEAGVTVTVRIVLR